MPAGQGQMTSAHHLSSKDPQHNKWLSNVLICGVWSGELQKINANCPHPIYRLFSEIIHTS